MKIGFSLGRCVRDIADGRVDIDDVAFIIAATFIKDEQQLRHVVENYATYGPYMSKNGAEACYDAALKLWNSSKILQPRREGLHRHMQPADSVWVDIFPTALSDNDNVKNAWNNYRIMINMVENIDNDAMEIFK